MQNIQDIESLYKQNNFPSRKRLHEILRENNIKATYKQVSEFVDRQAINQLHKQKRNMVSKQHQISSFKVNDEWQIDLLDYSKYSYKNKGFKWLFICVDVFTRKAFIEPIKSKQPSDTYVAFEKIVKRAGKPIWVYHDQGREWLGQFKLYCEKENIVSLTNLLHEHTSLAIVDRFSRTIKSMIEKYMTGYNTTSFVDKVSYLVNLYNNTPHSGIEGIKPGSVEGNPEIRLAVATLNAEKRISNNKIDKNIYKIKVGDSVRLQIEKQTFTKGYKVTFSKEIFTVVLLQSDIAALSNNKQYRIDRLLKVPADTVDINTSKKDKDEQVIQSKQKFDRLMR